LRALRQAKALRPGAPDDVGLAAAALAQGLAGEFIDEGIAKPFSRERTRSTTRRQMTLAAADAILHGLVRDSPSRNSD